MVLEALKDTTGGVVDRSQHPAQGANEETLIPPSGEGACVSVVRIGYQRSISGSAQEEMAMSNLAVITALFGVSRVLWEILRGLVMSKLSRRRSAVIPDRAPLGADS